MGHLSVIFGGLLSGAVLLTISFTIAYWAPPRAGVLWAFMLSGAIVAGSLTFPLTAVGVLHVDGTMLACGTFAAIVAMICATGGLVAGVDRRYRDDSDGFADDGGWGGGGGGGNDDGPCGPQGDPAWWPQFEADLAAWQRDHAVERQVISV